MKKIVYIIASIALVAMAATGCKDDNPDDSTTLTLAKTEFSAKERKDTVYVSIIANKKPACIITDTWIREIELSQQTSMEDWLLKLECDQTNSALPRTTTITIVNGTKKQDIAVTQVAAEIPAARRSDSLALVDMYNALDGSNWGASQWDLYSSIDTWKGVELDSNKRVAILDMGKMRFTSDENARLVCKGTLPVEALSKLTALRRLCLAGEDLTGSLAGVGKMQITYLEIYHTGFTTLNFNWSSFQELKELLINGNKALVGNIFTPAWADMKSLERFTVSSCVNAELNIPSEWGDAHEADPVNKFPKLKVININYMKFDSNPLPASLGKLTGLTQLLISRNSTLTGTIPSELANLKKLTALQLDANGLTGNIPASFATFPVTLVTLALSNNHLTGEIPLAVLQHPNWNTGEWYKRICVQLSAGFTNCGLYTP